MGLTLGEAQEIAQDRKGCPNVPHGNEEDT